MDINDNSLTVTDNGVGLTREKYQQFSAPSFSFKSGSTRGHKGVGATYIAYGFNHVQISTKTDEFQAVGKMVNARKWLNDENPAGNPKVYHDATGPHDPYFNTVDSGVSIYVKFDKTTHPGDLNWIKANNAEQWFRILSIKTGIGAFFPNNKIELNIVVIDANQQVSSEDIKGVEYFWPHKLVSNSQALGDLDRKETQLYAAKGRDFKMPSSMMNLDAIYDILNVSQLKERVGLDDAELEICNKHNPMIYFCYVYSAKVWQSANTDIALRQGVEIITPGVQIAANNMPQGEVIQIPLTKNIGRQNQMQVVIHFENCRGDLGRKGFQKEVVEFSKSIARKIIEKPVERFRYTLRPITGVREDLVREDAIDKWKEEMTLHEQSRPLLLTNENFFHPMKQVAITSIPTREQDVIALFNQLLAGGVIRGIRIMSTNERFTYDGMYHVVFNKPLDIHIHDDIKNPLGVVAQYVNDKLMKNADYSSRPRILEYKYSLDALIEDIGNGDKNPKDLGLVVVWETGSDYQGSYKITSLLDPNNLWERQYHGITHVMTNIQSGQREMDLIVIKELVEFLNSPQETIHTTLQVRRRINSTLIQNCQTLIVVFKEAWLHVSRAVENAHD